MLIALPVGPLAAQDRGDAAAGPGAEVGTTGRFEIRPIVGAARGTAAMHDLLTPGPLVGGQFGIRVLQPLAVTGTFGWIASRDRTTVGGSAPTVGLPLVTGRRERVDVFQYTLGIEGRLPSLLGRSPWGLSPFAGVGGGGVSYRYRDVANTKARHTPAGFVALGLDVMPVAGRLGLRVEGRSTFSRFRGLRGERPASNRNQVSLTAGLTLAF